MDGRTLLDSMLPTGPGPDRSEWDATPKEGDRSIRSDLRCFVVRRASPSGQKPDGPPPQTMDLGVWGSIDRLASVGVT